MKCVQIRFHGLIEVICRQLINALAILLPPRIDHKQIEATEGGDSFVDQTPTPSLVLDVTRQRQRLPARGFDKVDNLLGIRLLSRKISNGYIRPFPRKGYSDGPTYPRIAPCHERLAPSQPTRAPIAFLAVVRHRIHVSGKARHLRLLWKRRRRILLTRIPK